MVLRREERAEFVLRGQGDISRKDVVRRYYTELMGGVGFIGFTGGGLFFSDVSRR